MPRATIIVATDIRAETDTADDWFMTWRSQMTFISDNSGCGCCVDIFDVEGSQLAIDAIPAALRAIPEK